MTQEELRYALDSARRDGLAIAVEFLRKRVEAYRRAYGDDMTLPNALETEADALRDILLPEARHD